MLSSQEASCASHSLTHSLSLKPPLLCMAAAHRYAEAYAPLVTARSSYSSIIL